MFRRRTFVCAALPAALVSFCLQAAAEDAPGWKDQAELSLVATSGNAQSTSFGFKNTLVRDWDTSSLTVRLAGIRVDATTVTRTASGGVVTETEDTQTTAESYLFNGRYAKDITERLFWFTGAGWERNEPAGTKNRYIAEAGVGNIWHDTDDLKFKTGYAATYTDQEDTSGFDDSFAGIRLGWEYENKWGTNTTYTNLLVLDENLDETSDWRGDMLQGVAVAMSEQLALKVGLRLLYDNRPAIELVPDALNPTVPVPFELEELDTILTVSLVVDFK